jgi:predicted O-linked N-acetylglucosamine transferase (SPINDLY family)
LSLQPDDLGAKMHLGVFLWQSGKLDAAATALEEISRREPDDELAHLNLGIILGELGRGDKSVASLRRAVALSPASSAAHSVLLQALHYSERCDRRALFNEHLAWAKRQVNITGAGDFEPAGRKPHERLRIGYVSSDFREHPTARFIAPLLDHHDQTQFEIFCYSDVKTPDAKTASLRSHCEQWRNVAELSVSQVQELIRANEIDILVDLAGHYSNRLLLVFADRTAPVQVTQYGYLNTTGLPTIDWRITDSYFDPPGSEAFHTERLMRLEGSAWVYRPIPADDDAGPLPLLRNGHITFGCLNRFAKVSPRNLRLWGQILRALPTSRLLLHTGTPTPAEPSVVKLLAGYGVDTARVNWAPRVLPADYLRQYQRIDIALDTYPQNGGVTTLDSLYRGVPVISRYGEDCRSRLGLGILSNLGLAELAVGNDEDYVGCVIGLARDIDRLKRLRAALPQMMRSSPLMDESAFTRKLEVAYRRMSMR